MCAASKPEDKKPDILSAEIYFPTVVYQIEKPEFLDAVRNVAENALVDVRNNAALNDIYPVHMTDNLFDTPDIIQFQYYVGATAYNILNDQGYKLDGFEPYFSEMWCQEHYKHSGMEQHVHGAGSQIVGFYFLDTPKKCSKVVFHDPRPAKSMSSWAEQDVSKATSASGMINFTPKPGLLMFTNAWLPHSFSRHGSEEPMRFIHFNIGLRSLPMQQNHTCQAPSAEVI